LWTLRSGVKIWAKIFMLRNAPQDAANYATTERNFVKNARVRIMTKGTWQQQLMKLFLRRERIKVKKQASELQKKLSQDRINIQGLGEEE